MGSIHEKNRGQKSRDTASLNVREIYKLFYRLTISVVIVYSTLKGIQCLF